LHGKSTERGLLLLCYKCDYEEKIVEPPREPIPLSEILKRGPIIDTFMSSNEARRRNIQMQQGYDKARRFSPLSVRSKKEVEVSKRRKTRRSHQSTPR